MQEKAKRNPLLFLIGNMWHFSEGNQKRVAVFWLLFAVAQCIDMFGIPLAFFAIISIVETQGITPESFVTLLEFLGLIIAAEVGSWFFHGPARVMERCNAFKVRVNYRRHMLSGIMNLPLDWHTDHHSGDTIDKIEKGSAGIYQFSSGSFEILYGVIQLAGSYCVLAYFSPSSGVLVAGMILVIAWIIMRFDRILVEQYRALSRAENEISKSILDAVTNITTVIILRVEKLVFTGIMHSVEKPFDLLKKNATLNELKWFCAGTCSFVMTAAVLGTYFWAHMGTPGGALVATTVLLMQYLEKMRQTFVRFNMSYGDVLQRRAWVANAEELSVDFKTASFSNHVLPKEWNVLSIEGLDFSYHVGETGSGKTTLLKVMRNLYHPLGLRLSVDGTDILHGFDGISRAIALVPQNPEIFATTILDNITLRAEYDRRVVEHFSEMACFSDVVAALPNGYASLTKEKGVNLSGGQQQRLALARGLLACRDKDIVLLDEPTSSLDALTEMKVYENIFREFADKTIISSIHRLHLLPLFDRICMFESGKIIADGTLPELLQTCPKFASMWETMQRLTAEGATVLQ